MSTDDNNNKLVGAPDVRELLWNFVSQFVNKKLHKSVRVKILKARDNFEQIVFTDMACISLSDVAQSDVALKLSKHKKFMLLNVDYFMEKLKKYDAKIQKSIFDSSKFDKVESSGETGVSGNSVDSLPTLAQSPADDIASTPKTNSGEFEKVDILFDLSNSCDDYDKYITVAAAKELIRMAILPLYMRIDTIELNNAKMTKTIELNPEQQPIGFWLPTSLLPTHRSPDATLMSDSLFGMQSSSEMDTAVKEDTPSTSMLQEEEGQGLDSFETRLWHKAKDGYGRRWFVSTKELNDANKSRKGDDLSILLNLVFGNKYVQDFYYYKFFTSDLEKATTQLLVLYAKVQLPKSKSVLSEDFRELLKKLRKRLGKLMWNHRQQTGMNTTEKARAALEARNIVFSDPQSSSPKLQPSGRKRKSTQKVTPTSTKKQKNGSKAIEITSDESDGNEDEDEDEDIAFSSSDSD